MIVGLIRDARYTGVREAAPPTIYVPAGQMLEGTAAFYVRAAADPASLGPAIRAAVREADPMLPVIDLHTQDEQVERLTSQERLFARLSGCFGAIALASGMRGTVRADVVIWSCAGPGRSACAWHSAPSPGRS